MSMCSSNYIVGGEEVLGLARAYSGTRRWSKGYRDSKSYDYNQQISILIITISIYPALKESSQVRKLSLIPVDGGYDRSI